MRKTAAQRGRCQSRPPLTHHCWPVQLRTTKPLHQTRNVCQAVPPTKEGTSSSGREVEQTTGVGLKAAWYAAELFGKAVGGAATTATVPKPASDKVLTREEIVTSIKADYSTNYFVSGLGDMVSYADDCEFSDPFVAFKGTARFKQNVGNLGGLMRDVKLDVYDVAEPTPTELVTKWRFSCILDLPWRPLLAAAGGTTHVIDLASGRVVKHIERWDVEPSRVVQQLFRPASKIPSNAWETFFLSASEGDGKGVWLALTPLLLRLTAPVVAISITCKAITGEGLPGVALGALEGVSWLLLLAAGVTEVTKLVKGATGGESG